MVDHVNASSVDAPEPATTEITAVRIKLGPERPAPHPDPLGRAMIGYADGLSSAELWERGRGVWRAKLATVAEAEIALLVVDDVVRLVGTVEGVTFHDDRVAITGQPISTHPLIGRRDPLSNRSQNPIAYGTVQTTRPAPPGARDYAVVLAEAIRVLTEAARLRRAVLQPAAGGGWEPDPSRTTPVDWAEFVTQALAGAAANIGGIERVLAGRPGSWEADGVRALLTGTVGHDEEYLWEHRTEPLRVILDPDLAWLESLYFESEEAIDERAEAARSEFDTTAHQWIYRRTDAAGTPPFTGDYVCDDPAAPPWTEAVERLKEDLAAFGLPESTIDVIPSEFTPEAWVSKSDEDRTALVRLDALAGEAAAPYERLTDALRKQERRDLDDYHDQLRAAVREEAARRYPGVTVEFPEDATGGGDLDADFGPEAQLADHAIQHTPLPGSGIAPKDYPPGQEIENIERAAGRLPHRRLAHVDELGL